MGGPALPQNKHFAFEGLHFCSFAASPKSMQNDPKNDPEMTQISSQIGAGGPPKSHSKNKSENGHQQMRQEIDFGPTMINNCLQKPRSLDQILSLLVI